MTMNNRFPRAPYVLLAIGALLYIFGSYWGLFVAPREEYMGDVQRIMYVHVPTAWNWMLAVIFAFVSAVAFLFTSNYKWDARSEAGLEVSSLLAFLLGCQGSIWAKPTWGVWWDWDPRLTTVAILLMAFLGITALRNYVDDPVRRATWSSVATVVGYIDVPIVYFSVKWWNSLHQQQSNFRTVNRDFLIPLFTNFAGMLLVIVAVMIVRTRTAAHRVNEEMPLPLEARTMGELA